MPNVLVRDLPDDVHAALQRRAAARHQSLQQYLIVELQELAGKRGLVEILDEVDTRVGGRVGFAEAVGDLEDGRSRQ